MLALALVAAGLFYPDVGGQNLGRGGTGAASPGDLSALAINPAGLASLTGLRVQGQLDLVWQPLDFTRAGNCGGNPCATASDSTGAFLNTVSGISYAVRPGLVVAAGIYGPPSVGREQFPDPRTNTPSISLAPQRYSLIAENNLVLYPSLALAYRPLAWLDVGAVIQLRYFRARQSQSIYTLPGGGEATTVDAVASADATDSTRLTFGAGLIARPLDGLSIGLSFRPAEPVHAKGTLDVALPGFATGLASVSGRDADIEMTLAPEARLGTRWDLDRLSLLFDVVWQNWGVFKSIRVVPLDIVLHQQGTADLTIAPIDIPRDWHASWSFRLGGEYAWNDWLGLRAGALFESSAIPKTTQQIDFYSPPRVGVSAGLSARLGLFTATAGFAHFFEQDRDVTNSQILRVNPYPNAPPFTIGNGQYSGSLDLLSLQLVALL